MDVSMAERASSPKPLYSSAEVSILGKHTLGHAAEEDRLCVQRLCASLTILSSLSVSVAALTLQGVHFLKSYSRCLTVSNLAGWQCAVALQ